MLKQPLSNSTAKTSMAVPSQSTKPVPAKTVLQAAAVVVADALMALAATSVAVVAAVVVMTAVAVAVVAAVDAATSVVVNCNS